MCSFFMYLLKVCSDGAGQASLGNGCYNWRGTVEMVLSIVHMNVAPVCVAAQKRSFPIDLES